MNELAGTVTLSTGVQARLSLKILLDSLEGTVVWEFDPMACPLMIVQLYKGLMKVYINQTNVLEESTAVIEHKDKDQAVRQEIIESFILCGYQAYKMHEKSIAIYVYNDNRVELACGWFTDKSRDIDTIWLKFGMSFLQVKSSMIMKEKLQQVLIASCVNQRKLAHTQLETVAGAENPYNLITIFGRGHLAIKADGAVVFRVEVHRSKFLLCIMEQRCLWTQSTA